MGLFLKYLPPNSKREQIPSSNKPTAAEDHSQAMWELTLGIRNGTLLNRIQDVHQISQTSE